MRILYLRPGCRFKLRLFYYSFYKMLLAGVLSTPYFVSFFSDRDIGVCFFAGWRYAGKPFMRRHFLSTCEMLKPDLIVWCHADLVDANTLAQAKFISGATVCMVDCDYLDEDRPKSSVRRLDALKSVIDAAFFTTGGERLHKAREVFPASFFVPNPLDEAQFSLSAQRDRPIDVGYVSSGRRGAMLDYLRTNGLDVKIRGGKGKQALYGMPFEQFLCSAKCSVVDSLYNADMYSSDRIAQIFGAGAVAIVPRSVGLQKYIADSDVVYFDEPSELPQKLKRLVKGDSWFERGQRGRDAYLDAFGSAKVANYIVAKSMAPSTSLGSFDAD
ncbi:MAG: glycosyltransferase [Cohaesibacteraceae bacterium]